MEPSGFPLILQEMQSWASTSWKDTQGRLKQLLGAIISANQSAHTRSPNLQGLVYRPCGQSMGKYAFLQCFPLSWIDTALHDGNHRVRYCENSFFFFFFLYKSMIWLCFSQKNSPHFLTGKCERSCKQLQSRISKFKMQSKYLVKMRTDLHRMCINQCSP